MQFKQAVHVLCDAEVEFVVIGGLAANLQGSAYVTLDFGICYSQASVNLTHLLAALAPFHPLLRGCPEALPVIWDETLLRNTTLLTLLTDLGGRRCGQLG
jgi:hypothetical protein